VRQLIIVEGPDCSGKTTLSKYLARSLRMSYWKCNSAMRGKFAMAHFQNVLDCVKFNISCGQGVVIDRHWPSEMIYGPLCGREGLTAGEAMDMDSQIMKMSGLYVLCRRCDVVDAHARKKDTDHPYEEELFRKIVSGYEQFAQSMYDRDDVLIYSYEVMSHQLERMAEMVRDTL